ncbi:MAG: maleylpyruvate isomerase family mycothiol-dependent enzyme [Candidatus Kaistia colombiensis]|nr:MAG: maleylpyruvate isomerase family mycothiol-dependent enzyme [Kaistia sp.]
MPDASTLEAARASLRRRQGLGARYDAAEAPAQELDWARRGTAYFARKLNELRDSELGADSAVAGWTRRHVIAATAYHARMLARAVEAARTGAAIALYEHAGQREAEIEDGATLPASALRHLVDHAAVHLNVEWRDLSAEAWDGPLPYAALPTARHAPWLRAKQVWLRALDLRNGASPRDFPRDFHVRLLSERLSSPVNLPTDLQALAAAPLAHGRSDY